MVTKLQQLIFHSKEQASQALIKWQNKTGKEPTISDLRKQPELPSDAILKRLFNESNFSEIKKKIGIETKQENFSESKKDTIVSCLAEYIKTYPNKRITCHSFHGWLKEKKNISSTFWKYKDEHGETMTWNVWLSLANGTINQGSYTKKKVLEILLTIVTEFKKENGYYPSQKQIQEKLPKPLHLTTISRKFENKAINQILVDNGFVEYQNDYGDEELLDIMNALEDKIGRPIKQEDFKGPERIRFLDDGTKIPEVTLYRKRFNGFKNAKKLAKEKREH